MARSLLCALALLFTVAPAAAGEWPQILGPQRNGIAQEESIAGSFPPGGPRVLWERPVGEGFAGVAVAGGRVALFHRVGDEERLEVLSTADGKPIWRTGWSTRFTTAFSDDDGPRCTPLMQGGRVYVFGASGGLRCCELKSGKRLWARETHRDFKAPEGYFGAGSTPIIEGELIVVNVGSRDGAGIVAFDLADGRTVWKATNEQASYSSPVAGTVDGVRHLIFVTRSKTVSLDPRTGRVRFEFPFGRRGPTVNAASPLVIDGRLFVTAHYGVGAVWAKIGREDATIEWNSDDVLSCHYATPIEHDGKLYGIHGQERVTEPILRCIDPRTGKVHWSQPGVGYGSLVRADGKLLFLTTRGDLVLIKPDPSGYREIARTRLFETTTRALPALADGRLYARDTKMLKCVDLRARKLAD